MTESEKDLRRRLDVIEARIGVLQAKANKLEGLVVRLEAARLQFERDRLNHTNTHALRNLEIALERMSN